MRERRFREAADALADAVAQNPEDATSWRLLGGALVALGDTRGAVAAFECALALAPNLPKNHYNLALALQASGDRSGARQYLNQTLVLDPLHEQAQLRLQELDEAPPLPLPPVISAPPPTYQPPSGGYVPPPVLGYGQQQAQRELPSAQATYSLAAPKINGGVVLAWGVIGLVVSPVFSPLAWQMGNRALETLNRHPEADQSQRSNIMVGRTLGIIGTLLLLLGAALLVLVLLVAR